MSDNWKFSRVAKYSPRQSDYDRSSGLRSSWRTDWSLTGGSRSSTRRWRPEPSVLDTASPEQLVQLTLALRGEILWLESSCLLLSISTVEREDREVLRFTNQELHFPRRELPPVAPAETEQTWSEVVETLSKFDLIPRFCRTKTRSSVLATSCYSSTVSSGNISHNIQSSVCVFQDSEFWRQKKTNKSENSKNKSNSELSQTRFTPERKNTNCVNKSFISKLKHIFLWKQNSI